MEPRRAIVAGASGLIGGHLLGLLLENPAVAHVTALVRRPLPFKHRNLTQLSIDFGRLEVSVNLTGATEVYCAIGTTMRVAGSREAFRKVDLDYPLRLARAASAAGVRQFLFVTSVGADSHSRIFYNRVKGELEHAVMALPLSTSVAFRPSMLLGERTERRLAEAAASVVMRAAAPLMVGPLRRYRPIQAKTVARAMVRAADTPLPGFRILESEEIAALGNRD